MYQHQLTLLLKHFNDKTNQKYQLIRLLNDADYRNQSMAQQLKTGSASMQNLVTRIQSYEDILHHELQVDTIGKNPADASKGQWAKWRLALFAVACLGFAAASLAITENIQHQRQQVENQAE